MDISVLGIDLGKNSCCVVGLDAIGKVVVRRRMRRETVITYAATLQACVVAMEACCGAHHMGRALARQGHAIRLMSPEYVRPYVKAQKNDDRDAEAIAEAATRPTMRFVELKTEEQLDMQTLHRIRDQLVGDRTSLMNQIRSLLLERGYIVPQGRAKLALRLGEMLDGDEPVLGSRIHRLVSDMRLRWSALDERIADLDAEFTDAARADERTRRLLTITVSPTPSPPKLRRATRRFAWSSATLSPIPSLISLQRLFPPSSACPPTWTPPTFYSPIRSSPNSRMRTSSSSVRRSTTSPYRPR